MAKVRYLGGKSADLGTLRADQNYHTYNASDDHLDGYSEVYVDVPVPTLGIKGIVSNGTYYASDDDLGGYSEVRVNVPAPPVLLDELVVTQNNTTYNASSYGVEGWNKVTSAINIPVPVLDSIEITENGVYNAISYDLEGFDSVRVQVPAPTPTETVLWTNSSPTVNFAGQTITLSDNLSNYDYIGVKIAYSTGYQTDEYCNTAIMSISDFVKSSGSGRRPSMGLITAYNSGYARSCQYVSDTSVTIGNCYQMATSTGTNQQTIPLQVIGIKL